ncbi:anthranilate phosphoribosyltransferase [Paenibacillus oryzisoli]|uniref:anthranilate phosphoribosyltransferase n=1 Tax=Paenibacillus oryzisoli TaxID=1850517 RepID=UPI003D2B1396
MKRWIQAMSAEQPHTRNLTYEEAREAAADMTNGASTDAQCAAFLMALCMKGEALEETMAFIDVFRSHAVVYSAVQDSLNCAGPAEGRQTFPVTLPVSLLLASVGFKQVMHGGTSFTTRQGTVMKELLEGLGVATNVPIKGWQAMLQQVHIGFLSTEQLCPPIGRLKGVREQLGLRTVIDTVEKVLNPVRSTNVILGVHQRKAMEPLIPIAMHSGFQQTYLVSGIEGSEDLPLYASSLIRIVTPWGDETRVMDPQKFGFRSEPLPVLSRDEQMELIRRIITGDESSEVKRERDHVIFNAGLRFMWFEKVGSYEEGFQLAEALLKRKEANKVMQRWVERSQHYARQQPPDGGDAPAKIG